MKISPCQCVHSSPAGQIAACLCGPASLLQSATLLAQARPRMVLVGFALRCLAIIIVIDFVIVVILLLPHDREGHSQLVHVLQFDIPVYLVAALVMCVISVFISCR